MAFLLLPLAVFVFGYFVPLSGSWVDEILSQSIRYQKFGAELQGSSLVSWFEVRFKKSAIVYDGLTVATTGPGSISTIWDKPLKIIKLTNVAAENKFVKRLPMFISTRSDSDRFKIEKLELHIEQKAGSYSLRLFGPNGILLELDWQ